MSLLTEQTVAKETRRQQYVNIITSIQEFHPVDIKTLHTIFDLYFNENPDNFIILDEQHNNTTIGFIIFNKAPITQCGWDIFWLAVQKDFQGKGFGGRLLQRVEKHILSLDPKAVIRVETSRRKEYAHARYLYAKHGYTEAGRISDFYSEGDDLVLMSKHIGAWPKAL